MKLEVYFTERGFTRIDWTPYARESLARLLQESSAISPKYDDAFDRPGSSYLWIGDDFHLDRDMVKELIAHLQRWVDTGSLAETKP